MIEGINLNEYEASEAMDVAFDYDIGSLDKGQKINDLRDAVQNPNQVLAKGMVFDTDMDAYNFYNGYARLIGFSIRKNKMYRNKAFHIARRDFTCSWEGQYKKKLTPKKKREDRRSGCQAMLMIRRDKNGKYVVTDFVENHNHVLVEPEDAHLLRSHRRIENSQRYLIGNMRKAGISTANIISYLSMEAGGAKNLNFTGSDCYNLVSKSRTKFLKEGDAQCLLKYLQDKKAADKFFYYKLRVDESNRFCGVFIADAKSRCDYGNFGDVMCFDTTFKTNNYDMICAPIIGVNHHGQTVIFGLGLLHNETTESLMWLFETFLEAMGGKHPQTIFTDQALAIAKAISLVFPYSNHRLCLWHIGMNAAKNLSKVYSKFKSFKADFRECIYNGETVEEFERNWKQMLLTYGLQKNKWLQNLYRLRGRWAQVYARDNFCAGMTTTQRSEIINSLLKKFVGGNLILREFIVQHDGVLASRREKERIANTENKKKMSNMVTEWAVEREASEIYTRKAFEIFQSECKRCFTLKVDEYRDDGEECYYKIRRVGTNAKPRSVTYKPANQGAKCSCKKFEFQGILCSHILKVFLELEVSSLPPQFYMKRWTMDATSNLVYDTQGEVIEANLDPERSKRYSELSHWVQILVAKAARTKETKELAIKDVLHTISKLDSLVDNDAVTCDGGVSQSFGPASNVNDATEANIPATLLDPISKKRSRQPNGRKKSVIEKKKRKTKDKSLERDKDEQNDLSPTHGKDFDLNEVPDLNEELNDDFDPQPARRLDFTNP